MAGHQRGARTILQFARSASSRERGVVVCLREKALPLRGSQQNNVGRRWATRSLLSEGLVHNSTICVIFTLFKGPKPFVFVKVPAMPPPFLERRKFAKDDSDISVFAKDGEDLRPRMY